MIYSIGIYYVKRPANAMQLKKKYVWLYDCYRLCCIHIVIIVLSSCIALQASCRRSFFMHSFLAQFTNCLPQAIMAFQFPRAPIKQLAMLGKHCVAQPASPFARHSPNLAKHLAFSTAPIADVAHSCSSASHFLMMSMTPLSTSPTAAF